MHGPRQVKKILLIGHGEAGKDYAATFLSALTGLRNAGATSWYLCGHMALRTGKTQQEIYDTRRENRPALLALGRELRELDPGILLRQAFANGEIANGARDDDEIIAGRQTWLVDFVIWIENYRAKVDPQTSISSKLADAIIENNGTKEEFQERLTRLAKFAGLA